MYTYMYIHIYIISCICVYIYIYIYICLHTYICVCVYIYIYIYYAAATKVVVVGALFIIGWHYVSDATGLYSRASFVLYSITCLIRIGGFDYHSTDYNFKQAH